MHVGSTPTSSANCPHQRSWTCGFAPRSESSTLSEGAKCINTSMKLKHIAEGLKIAKDQDGRKVIDFVDDNKSDDKYFSKITSSAGRSSKKINLHKDDVSTEEIHQLKGHIDKEPKAYQAQLPTYTAMPLFSPGETSAEFLDALKQRDEENVTFSKEGLDALMTKGAKSTVGQLAKDRNGLKMFSKVVIIPIPSGKSLVYGFAEKVAEAVKQYNSAVVVSKGALSKAASAKYGTVLRGGRLDKEEQRPDRFFSRTKKFRPEAYAHMFSLFKAGQKSEAELIDFYTRRVGEIETHANILSKSGDSPKVKSEREALEQEKAYLEKFLDRITDPKYVDKQNLSPEEIKNVRGLLRRLSYDRFNVTDEEPFQRKKEKERTLIILVDDNIDTSKSLIDTYRVLFKKGLVDARNSLVVAIALHQLKSPSKEK